MQSSLQGIKNCANSHLVGLILTLIHDARTHEHKINYTYFDIVTTMMYRNCSGLCYTASEQTFTDFFRTVMTITVVMVVKLMSITFYLTLPLFRPYIPAISLCTYIYIYILLTYSMVESPS